jgi:hypothetical protein
MTPQTYHFVTIWQVKASLKEVWDIIIDVNHLPTWWPAVIKVKEIQKGDENGVNKIVEQTWKGILPYQLILVACITKVDYLKSIELTATGNLEGQGKWTFKEENGIVILQYDWQVTTTQTYLNVLGVILKPVLAWNHDVIMKWGEQGLVKKLNHQ